MQLVRYRTAQILSIENIVARQTGGRMSSQAIKRLTAEQVEALGFGLDITLALESNRAVSQVLEGQIEALEKRLNERVKLRPQYHLLKTAPGIGETLATTIMLETGTVTRFAEVGNFSSYCRCVDTLRESNDKKKGEGNAKNGNKYLAWALVEAANFARRNLSGGQLLGRTLNCNPPADLLRTASSRIGCARWGIVRRFGQQACSRYSIGLGKRSASGPKGLGDSAEEVFRAGWVACGRVWATLLLRCPHGPSDLHRLSTPAPPRGR